MTTTSPPLSCSLTTREREIVALMALGYSDDRICIALCLDPELLTAIVDRIHLKLDVQPTPVYHQRVRIVLAWVAASHSAAAAGGSPPAAMALR